MPEHLSTQQVAALVARRLAPGELSSVMRHLAGCDHCRARVNAANRTEERLAALRTTIQSGLAVAPEHLSYEQLSSFVDRSLAENERAAVESHLGVCEDCTARAQELEELWASIRADAIGSAGQPIERPGQKKAAWGRYLATSWRWGAVAIAALALLFAAVIIRQWRQSRATQVARINPAPPVSPANVATPSTPRPTPPAASENIAALTDHGRRVSLNQQGSLIGLPPLPPAYEQIVKTALAEQRAPVSPVATELAPRKGALLGRTNESETFDLLTPIGTVVLSDRPTFRWQKVASAESYSVAVLDQKLNVVAKSEPVSGTSWTPPTGLPRDQVLLWQVTAKVGEKQITAPAPPAPEARFKILSQAKSAGLSRAAKQYADSHLMLGALYAEAGLNAEAEREFRALAAENRGSQLAQNLLRSVRSRKKLR